VSGAAAKAAASNAADKGDAHNPYALVNCELCRGPDHADKTLLCDQCDGGYHMFCLSPPLTEIPAGQWYCPNCVGEREQFFGYETGREYCLRAFQKHADSFKRDYICRQRTKKTETETAAAEAAAAANGGETASDSPRRPNRVTKKTKAARESELKATVAAFDLADVDINDVVRAYWTAVEDTAETREPVAVEYGSDIDTTLVGSGFPSEGAYGPANDDWNLNRFPLLRRSMLRFLDDDTVDGVTVPWLYVGMMFSSFCWHTEDHDCYSINYNHIGDTKQWYGVPGKQAPAFERVMRATVPHLFKLQPDLLFHLGKLC
jgi:histone demethylase JARID1